MCAAHTAVDKAEEGRGLAFAINAVGAANLARAAARDRCLHGADLDRLRLCRRRRFPGCRGRTARSRLCLAGPRSRASGRCGPSARSRGSSGPRGSTVPPARPASQGDEAPGRGPRLTHRGQRPGRPADVDPRPRRGRRAPRRPGAPFGVWHGTGSGQCSCSTSPGRPSRSSASTPSRSSDHQRRVCRDVSHGRRAPGIPVLSHDKWAAAKLPPCPTGVTACVVPPRRSWPTEAQTGISPFLDPVRRRRGVQAVSHARCAETGWEMWVGRCMLAAYAARQSADDPLSGLEVGGRSTHRPRPRVGDGRCPPPPSTITMSGRCVGSACLPTGCR